jgi:uncharacterized protein
MNIKKIFWNCLGFISLGLAYVGVVTPGMPYSIFVVFAAYCFSKGSERMHRWIYNHKLFGPFLTNWGQKRVFPTKMKFFMLAMMTSSLDHYVFHRSETYRYRKYRSVYGYCCCMGMAISGFSRRVAA